MTLPLEAQAAQNQWGGVTDSIQVDPTSPSTLYATLTAGTPDQGIVPGASNCHIDIFESSDGGAHWDQVNSLPM